MDAGLVLILECVLEVPRLGIRRGGCGLFHKSRHYQDRPEIFSRFCGGGLPSAIEIIVTALTTPTTRTMTPIVLKKMIRRRRIRWNVDSLGNHFLSQYLIHFIGHTAHSVNILRYKPPADVTKRAGC
jgi:hypothetical protein